MKVNIISYHTTTHQTEPRHSKASHIASHQMTPHHTTSYHTIPHCIIPRDHIIPHHHTIPHATTTHHIAPHHTIHLHFLIIFLAGNGTYLVCYTPELNGRHDISVTIQDKPIKDSPFNVLVINRREYNEVGSTLMRFGQYGSKKKEFKSPFGVACDQSGHIYVADSYNHRIQVFGTKGEFVHFFGAHGERKGKYLSK